MSLALLLLANWAAAAPSAPTSVESVFIEVEILNSSPVSLGFDRDSLRAYAVEELRGWGIRALSEAYDQQRREVPILRLQLNLFPTNNSRTPAAFLLYLAIEETVKVRRTDEICVRAATGSGYYANLLTLDALADLAEAGAKRKIGKSIREAVQARIKSWAQKPRNLPVI